jgi:hypothetical protein
MLKTGANARDARRWLAKSGGNVRQALATAKKQQPKATGRS